MCLSYLLQTQPALCFTFMIHPFLSETDMHDFSRGTIAILVGETANTSISIEQIYVVFSSHDH